MKTKACCALLILVLVVAGCGDAGPTVDTQATGIAAGVAATLTAQAPPPQTVIIVTPPPPTAAATEPPTAVAIEPSPSIDLSDLHLEADGGGDLHSLEEALVQSAEGATISLGPGVYRLDQALTVGGSLHLVGAGRERTEIISSAPEWVLRFQGAGPFVARGITFRHEGDAPADVVAVTTGKIDFQDCRFTGGVSGEDSGTGSGISLEGSTTGQVSYCESLENELHGMLLWDQAQVSLSNNLVQRNGDTGLAYFGQTGGQATQNMVRENARYGIYVDDRAAPTLEGNVLSENGAPGIAFFGNAAGMVEGNRCAGGLAAGLLIAENAAPWLGDNECEQQERVVAPPDVPATVRREIVYAAWQLDNEDVYAMWADGTGVLRLTDDPARDNEPVWSPDGAQIAFVSERDGNPEIYVMNADGSDPRRLTHDPGEDRNPDWSPDGGQIAFASSRATDWGIYAISPDGSELQRMTPEDMGGSTPAWSPDGKKLAFATYVDRMPLLAILYPETGEVIALTQNSNQDTQPAWSPDGEQIAFISATDEDANWVGPELYVIAANGLDRTRLTHSDLSTESSPAWSPDGSQIAFAGTWDGYGAIYRIKPDGTGLAHVSRGSDPSGHPDWSSLPAPTREPRFNRAGEPWCFNTPALGADGDWQAVAPRELILPGERAEVKLRDNAGQAGVERPVRIRVITPNEQQSAATATIRGDDWLMLVYPDDFEGGNTAQRGAYTILWETEGQFVACDGFLIGGGAGP